MNNHAFTLIEMMMAVAFSVLLMTGVYGFYNASSQVYSTGISGQALQDAANIVLSKIIEGKTESGTVYRLSTAVSFMIPNGAGSALYVCGGGTQTTSCNTSNTSSELYYCQDNPCTGSTDATARWYYLNSTGTSIIYHHPASNGGTIEEKIYTAPTGSTLKLRFSPAQANNQTLPNVVEIDVDLTGNLSANVTNARLTTSGDVSTFVFLRNHP
jgi:prepilin-type N-terminal cleavage/methylation domain-containing protein